MGRGAKYTIRTQETFHSISKEMIEYPFDNNYDKETFAGYASGEIRRNYHLVPEYNPDKRCVHGNPFSQDFQLKGKCFFHLPHIDRKCLIYYRPAEGCNCTQDFDGRSEHLINLDGNHIFPYTWLMDILHKTQETRFPLHSAFRSARRTRMAVGQQRPTSRLYETLHQAYNPFIRLLDINYEDLYNCKKCGSDPDELVIDGIMMGSRKDLLPNFEMPPAPSIQVQRINTKYI